jgi:ZIP family zinc transporter
LEVARQRMGSQAGAVLVMGAGMLLGATALALLHRALPHEHFYKGREGAQGRRPARIWLLVLAIALHNIPEGLAVGLGAAAEGSASGVSGLSIALAIGAQNMPEGLVVAVALASQGYGRGFSVLVALLTGLVEPLAALPGALALTLAQSMLAWGLSGAAGAMLFVVSDEIIPETHRSGFERSATFALMLGFIGMMALGQALA